MSLYAAQIVTPLRLNTDAVRLLSMAVSASEGRGFLVEGEADPLPVGYPALLAGMIYLGLGKVWFNAAGIACVLGGCAFFVNILTAKMHIPWRSALLVCVVALASWVVVKHATLPLTENLYLGVSMAGLLCLERGWNARGWRAAGLLLAGFALAAMAASVRTIGISLVGTAGVLALLHPQLRAFAAELLRVRRGARVALAATIVVATVAVSVVGWDWMKRRAGDETKPNYIQQQGDALRDGVLQFARVCVVARLQETGELLVNAPAGKLPAFARHLEALGAFGLVFGALGLWQLSRQSPPLAVYLGFYVLIMFCWPFYDPRFWMPVAPLLALTGWCAIEPWLRLGFVRWMATAYVGVFLALGLLALGYSTRLSFSGRHFAELYGDGTGRDTYRLAFGSTEHVNPAAVDQQMFALLRRFEPLARPPSVPQR